MAQTGGARIAVLSWRVAMQSRRSRMPKDSDPLQFHNSDVLHKGLFAYKEMV